MGGALSRLPKSTTDSPYFSLTFCSPNEMKLVLANDAVIKIVRNAVVKCWPGGIQSERNYKGEATEFKLSGNPFYQTTEFDTALQQERFCCKILADLLTIGWKLVVASDLSQTTDFSTLFFRKTPYTLDKAPVIFSVSLSSTDALHLVNGSDHIRSVFKHAVATGYESGIRKESPVGPDFEVNLNGAPWRGSTLDDLVNSRKLLLELFRHFDQSGYQFYGTASFRESADCIFFVQQPRSELGVQYVMISLNANNLMLLIDCPQNVTDNIRALISRFWQPGLNTEKQINGAYEFKLVGSPWLAYGEDAIQSRVLITMMLQKLLSLGWNLVTSLDISRGTDDKSIFVFKSSQPLSVPYFCISLLERDKLHLINAPKGMTDKVKQVITDKYLPGIIKENSSCHNSHQFSLYDYPWSSERGDDLSAKYLMCFLLKAMEENGWHVVCSADVSAKFRHTADTGPDFTSDVHSWFLAQLRAANKSLT